MTCRICDKPANGIHYRVLSCGGCGAFFKRGVIQKINYLCYFGGNCSTTATNSEEVLRCKACRFWKCAELGMKIPGYLRPIPTKLTVEFKPPESTEQLTGLRNEQILSQFLIRPCLSDSDSTRKYITSDASSNGSIGVQIFSHPASDCLAVSKRVLIKTTCTSTLIPPGKWYSGGLDDTHHDRIASTVHAVTAAVEAVFRDQLDNWTACRDRALQYGQVMNQPETSLDMIVIAINYHNYDHVARTQKFAAMLPGMSQLEPSVKTCTTAGWKFLVFWMMHHAPFMTNAETYVTLGPEQFHYSKYWQDVTLDWRLMLFVYKFCSEFREIGLDETERYLLMALVIFEPVQENSSEEDRQLKIIHRHYAAALLDGIKRRCTDAEKLTVFCGKVERFLSMLKTASVLYQSYYGSNWQLHSPLPTVCASALVSRNCYQSRLESVPSKPGFPVD